MQRRCLLAATVCTVSGAGCLGGTISTDDSGTNTDRVTDFEAELVETGIDGASGPDATGATVTDENGTITIDGNIFVGSSSCSELGEPTVEYDQPDDQFVVDMPTNSTHVEGAGCSDDWASLTYKIVIDHNGDPDAVVVNDDPIEL